MSNKLFQVELKWVVMVWAESWDAAEEWVEENHHDITSTEAEPTEVSAREHQVGDALPESWDVHALVYHGDGDGDDEELSVQECLSRMQR